MNLAKSSLARWMLWLVAALGLLAIFYSLYAHDLIRAAFEASEAGQPKYAFIDHTRRTLDYYLARADLIFWQYVFVGIPLTILFWALLIRIGRSLLAASHDSGDATLPARFRHDGLIAFAVYTALTAIYFAPNLATFNSALIGPAEDNMAGYWSLWWGIEQALQGPHSLTFTNYVFFPEGNSLYYVAWSFYNLGIAALARIVFDPIATCNLVTLHSYPIAGIGAFFLVRRLTGNSWVALIGGFLFAFSPNHFARTQHHINVNSIQFIPYFVLAFWDCIRHRRRRDLLLAAIFFLLNTLCDWTYMIFASYFIAFGYIYLAAKNRCWLLGDYLKRSAVVIGSTLILLSPWLIPMIHLGLASSETNVGGRNTYVTDVAGLVIPSAYHWSASLPAIAAANDSYTGNHWEAAAYLGLFAIVIVLLAGKPLWRLAARWWLGLIAFLTLALGPQLHLFGKSLPIALPYTVIAYIPFLSHQRAPARFMAYVYLFWAALVCLALVVVIQRQASRRKRLLVGSLLAFLLLVDFFAINRTRTELSIPNAILALSDRENATAIFNLPRGYNNVVRYMMQQSGHGLPIVDGAAMRKVGRSLVDTLEMRELSRQRQQLAQAGVSHVIIHKYLLPDTLVNVADYRRVYDVESEDSLCLILRVAK